MADQVDRFQQADDLARDILRLTRNTLLVNLRFLDLALSQFQLSSYPRHPGHRRRAPVL